MILVDKIEKFEEELKDELKFANRIAFIHQNSKDLIKALRAELKESKERYVKELKKVG